MAIEGCGVSAFIVWKDATCSEIDEAETRKHYRRIIDEIKDWGYLVAGGVEAEIDTTTRAEKKRITLMPIPSGSRSKWLMMARKWAQRGSYSTPRACIRDLPLPSMKNLLSSI